MAAITDKIIRVQFGAFFSNSTASVFNVLDSFAEIVKYIPIKEIKAMYIPYHEMDIRQFVDEMNERYRRARPETNLKLRRQQAGLSQKELAELSGIPVRTIQQYEQRQKNINKAQVAYLLILARILCCDVENLIEIE